MTLEPSVTRDYDLAAAARWAHVQQDGSARLSRLVSERRLAKDAYQLAVIVPAFNAVGAPSWRPGERVTVPAYYWWHFRTAPDDEDFESLAEKLLPIETSDRPGWPRAGAGELPDRAGHAARRARGADPRDRLRGPPLPTNVRDDLEAAAPRPALLDPPPARGRPAHLRRRLGRRPRRDRLGARCSTRTRGHRGAAGLGAWAGVVIQEEIAARPPLGPGRSSRRPRESVG